MKAADLKTFGIQAIPVFHGGDKKKLRRPARFADLWGDPDCYAKAANRLRKKPNAVALLVSTNNTVLAIDIDSGIPFKDRLLKELQAAFLNLPIERSMSGKGYHVFLQVANKKKVARFAVAGPKGGDCKIKGLGGGELVYITANWLDGDKGDLTPLTKIPVVSEEELNKILAKYEPKPKTKKAAAAIDAPFIEMELDEEDEPELLKEKIRVFTKEVAEQGLELFPKGTRGGWFGCGIFIWDIFSGDDEGLELFRELSKCEKWPEGHGVDEIWNNEFPAVALKGEPVKFASLMYHAEVAGADLEALRLVLDTAYVNDAPIQEEVVTTPGPRNPDLYITTDEQSRVMSQVAIAPFLPLQLHDAVGDIKNMCTGAILAGPPGTGKGTITKLLRPLLVYSDSIARAAAQRMFDNGPVESEGGKELTENERRRQIPNISPYLEFSSSDAAILGSLTGYPALLLYGNEIDSMISSAGATHNTGRSELLRQLLEGEPINKVLKRQDTQGRTRFTILSPNVGLLTGGVPKTILTYMATQIDNGLLSRLLVMVLPETLDRDNPRMVNVPDLSKALMSEEMLNYVMGDASQAKDDYWIAPPQKHPVTYDLAYWKKLAKQLDEDYNNVDNIQSIVSRGLRDCVKRAGVQIWLDGERKKFVVTKKMLDEQVSVLRRSIGFISQAVDYRTNRYGESSLNRDMKASIQVLTGKAVLVQHGVAISKGIAESIKKVHDKLGSLRGTARAVGCSVNTVRKALKM